MGVMVSLRTNDGGGGGTRSCRRSDLWEHAVFPGTGNQGEGQPSGSEDNTVPYALLQPDVPKAAF